MTEPKRMRTNEMRCFVCFSLIAIIESLEKKVKKSSSRRIKELFLTSLDYEPLLLFNFSSLTSLVFRMLFIIALARRHRISKTSSCSLRCKFLCVCVDYERDSDFLWISCLCVHKRVEEKRLAEESYENNVVYVPQFLMSAVILIIEK